MIPPYEDSSLHLVEGGLAMVSVKKKESAGGVRGK